MWAKRFQMEDKFNSIGRAAAHRVGFTLFTLLLSSSIFFKQMDIKEIRWLAYFGKGCIIKLNHPISHCLKITLKGINEI